MPADAPARADARLRLFPRKLDSLKRPAPGERRPRSPFEANLSIDENNRPIRLNLNFPRKRFRVKRIGRLFSSYVVQSLHTPHFG